MALLAILICFTSLQGTEFLPLDPTELLICNLSSRHHNRLAIHGKKIRRVIYPDQALLIQIEEESGQIFIQALVDELQPITISVVTTDGVIQDLELHFSEKQSERVILEVPEHLLTCECETETSTEQISISEIIENIRQGYLPEDFILLEGEGNWGSVNKEIRYQRQYSISSSQQIIEVICFQNCSKKQKFLEEKNFIEPGIQWIYLDCHKLKKGERTWGIFAWRNNG
jgi:hypothetical protein